MRVAWTDGECQVWIHFEGRDKRVYWQTGRLDVKYERKRIIKDDFRVWV
jgi:hypothetical protein